MADVAPLLPPASVAEQTRPLRLALGSRNGLDRLDGGWWPHSRDLAVELRHLVEGFPLELGRITRALYSPPDWDAPPRRVELPGGFVKVGCFPDDDTHLIVLTTSNRVVLHLLVVPTSFTEAQGTEALLAAATPRYAHSATDLLLTVTNEQDADPADVWAQDGGESLALTRRTRGPRNVTPN